MKKYSVYFNASRRFQPSDYKLAGMVTAKNKKEARFKAQIGQFDESLIDPSMFSRNYPFKIER